MRAALVGKPLVHSYSKIIHERLGYPYDLVEVDEADLEGLIKSGKYDCFNITIPYKKTVALFVDEIDDTARFAGAINTVIARNRRLIGYNTDVLGLEYMLKNAGVELNGKCVMILGTGGTSNTASFVCERAGAKSVVKVGRSSPVNYSNCYDYIDTQIIINTTPAGMYPDYGAPPIDISRFSRLEGVADVVYNPVNTELVCKARGLGIKSVGGLSMLVAQAVYASEMFCQSKYPSGTIEQIYRYLKTKVSNVVLVGMPSSGKTTIGKMLASRMGAEFIDTDALVEQIEGVSIPNIINERGEEYFRDVESRAIEMLSEKKGCVIATGGGSVLREKNREILKRNSFVIHVERPFSELSSEGRPLSSTPHALQEMERVRMPIYREIRDFSVLNDGKTDKAVKLIEEVLL